LALCIAHICILAFGSFSTEDSLQGELELRNDGCYTASHEKFQVIKNDVSISTLYTFPKCLSLLQAWKMSKGHVVC